MNHSKYFVKITTVKIFLSIFIATSFLLSQQDKNNNQQYYYYYEGTKKYLTPSKEELYVSFKPQTDSLSIINIIKSKNLSKIRDLQFINNSSICLKTAQDQSLSNNLDKLLMSEEIESAYPVFLDKNLRIFLNNTFIYKKTDISNQLTLDSYFNKYNVSEVQTFNYGNDNKIILAKVGKGHNVLELINVLYENNLIQYSEPNFTFEMINSVVDEKYNSISKKISDPISEDCYPNDPGYCDGEQWYIDVTRAREAYDITTGNPEIIIVDIDAGFQLNHQEFTNPNKFVGGYDAYNNDNSPYPLDQYDNHGTHTAGIIAAKTNNGDGIASVGFNIKFMPIKIFRSTLGGGGIINSESVLRASDHLINLQQSYKDKIYAINNSWQYPYGYNQSVLEALQPLRQAFRNGKGATIVFSSGNDGSDIVPFPANSLNCIVVGGLSVLFQRWAQANYGPLLDLVAPCNFITTTDGLEEEDYVYSHGTSVAAPMVSAAIGLMASKNPTFSNDYYESVLLTYGVLKVSGYSFGNHSGYPYGTWNNEMGYGTLDCFSAVNQIVPENVLIPSQIYSNGVHDINATGYILAPSDIGGYVSVLANALVTFRAGDSIILKPGFSVTSGSLPNFRAYIQEFENLPKNINFGYDFVYKGKSRETEKQPIHLNPVKKSIKELTKETHDLKEINEYSSSSYPNPFNPTTLISYDLPKSANVKISIYDILGKEVAVLVDEYKSSGSYTVKFDGSNFSSGWYFYKIIAGNYINIQKIILLK